MKEEAEQNIRLNELEIILEEKLSLEENVILTEIENISKDEENIKNNIKENKNFDAESERYYELEQMLLEKYYNLFILNRNLLVFINPTYDLKEKITIKKITKNKAIYTLENYLDNITVINKNIKKLKLEIYSIKSEMELLTKKVITIPKNQLQKKCVVFKLFMKIHDWIKYFNERI